MGPFHLRKLVIFTVQALLEPLFRQFRGEVRRIYLPRTWERQEEKLRRALEAILMSLASAPVPVGIDGELVNLPRRVRIVALLLPL
jgi:hypothetical protein